MAHPATHGLFLLQRRLVIVRSGNVMLERIEGRLEVLNDFVHAEIGAFVLV